jgi:hypothetical protein
LDQLALQGNLVQPVTLDNVETLALLGMLVRKDLLVPKAQKARQDLQVIQVHKEIRVQQDLLVHLVRLVHRVAQVELGSQDHLDQKDQ